MPKHDRHEILEVIIKLEAGHGVSASQITSALKIASKTYRSQMLAQVHGLKTSGYVKALHNGIYQATESGKTLLKQYRLQEAERKAKAQKALEDAAEKAERKRIQEERRLTSTPAPEPAATAPAKQRAEPAPTSLDAQITAIANAVAERIASAILPAVLRRVEEAVEMAALEIATRPNAPSPEVVKQAVADVPTEHITTAPAANDVKDPPAPARPAIDTRSKLPSVVIVGMTAGQNDMLLKEFSDSFDMSFVDASTSSQERFRNLASKANYVVTLIGNVRHGHTDIARRSGAEFIPVTGGISMLRTKLASLVARHQTTIKQAA